MISINPSQSKFFFKHSSSRRKDFELCELETNLETEIMLRHVFSRWLSLRNTLTRIVKQWTNLKEEDDKSLGVRTLDVSSLIIDNLIKLVIFDGFYKTPNNIKK